MQSLPHRDILLNQFGKQDGRGAVNLRSILLRAFLLALASGAGAAHAQLSVDRLWVDFEPGAPRRSDIVIRNESSDRYYISVTPSEITSPGTDAEKRVEQADPEALGLLVTPNRLVIDPGGIRSIRVVSLDDSVTSDRIYRVKITPQVGELQSTVGEGAKGIAIKVLAAYDILVTARPKRAKPDLQVTRGNGELVIRNIGNSNTLLYEGRACSAGAPLKDAAINGAVPQNIASQEASAKEAVSVGAGCTELGARRIYSGNEWKIPVPDGQGKVKFKQRSLASSDPKEVEF